MRLLISFALLLAALALGIPARAAFSPDLWFAGTRLILDHAESRDGTLAIGTTDEGLSRFLGRLGATLAYQPGQRYIVVTTPDRRTINFVLGDTRFTVEGVAFTAPFAPYAAGREAFIPFFALAQAMYVMPVTLGSETVLQPQLGSLDVRNQGRFVVVTLRGATPLHYKESSDGNHVELNFSGVASTLDQSRMIGAPVLSQITVILHGTPRAPTTTVSFEGLAGAAHAIYASQSPNELKLAFRPQDVAASALSEPTPEPTPEPALAPQASPLPSLVPGAATAIVTAVEEKPSREGMALRIAVSGAASYEWRRLLDNRWYVDIHNALLKFPGREDVLSDTSVASVRMKQLMDADSAPFVRVALSLTTMRHIEVTPSDTALTVFVGAPDDRQPVRVGAGQVGPGAIALAPSSTSAPLPSSTLAPSGGDPWKFGAGGSNSRLIVIDPGHGGSDAGAQQNGLTEKDITLDVSRRLRDLLVGRGWTVKMTRDSDVDVFAPNDSARDELQARCDIANKAGARVYVSIHVNSFTSGDLNGTTTYYYKNEDLPLADAVHRRLISVLETKDDGVRKSNFYVIHHTSMPAILVETAFMSNRGDAALLRSSAFLQKVAAAVADGVGDYTGKTQTPVTSMVEQ